MSSTDAAAHATTEPGATHLPIAGGKGTWRYSLRVFGRRPWLLAATAVVMAGASLAGLATPAVLGWMVDAVVTGRAAALPWAAAVLAGAALLSAGLAAAGAVMMATVGQRGLAEMREEVFGAAVAQPPEAVERAGTGDLVSRVSDDVEAVNTAIGGILPTFVSALFTVALTLGGLGLIDLRFALAAVLCVPIQWFALRRFMRASAPLYRTMRMAESERGQHVLEAAGGADTVRSLGQETPALARVAEASLRAISLSLSSVVVRSRFFGRLNVAELVGLAAVLTTGYLLVAADAVTVGAATAAALFFHQLFNPIGVLLANVDELQKAGAGLARLVGVAESSTVDDAGPPGSPGPPARHLRPVGTAGSWWTGWPPGTSRAGPCCGTSPSRSPEARQWPWSARAVPGNRPWRGSWPGACPPNPAPWPGAAPPARWGTPPYWSARRCTCSRGPSRRTCGWPVPAPRRPISRRRWPTPVPSGSRTCPKGWTPWWGRTGTASTAIRPSIWPWPGPC